MRAQSGRLAGRFALFLGAALAVGSCAGGRTIAVTVSGDIPPPLVEQLPYRAAVYLSPEFSDYTTSEESLSGDTWKVSLGATQRKYVLTMLESTFEEVIVSTSASFDDITDRSIGIRLAPRVENFSFLTPSESGSKFFAVSMRHYVDFYTAQGQSFASWELNSYGRSRSEFGDSSTELADEACRDALRDFAASLAVGLPDQLSNLGIIDLDED